MFGSRLEPAWKGVLVASSLAFAGCEGETATRAAGDPAAGRSGPSLPTAGGYPLSVRLASGKEVEIPSRPRRIAVVGTPLYTEIIVDLGAGERIVAVTDSPDNPAEVASVPRLGKPLSWSLERLVLLQPDVVFGAIGRPAEKLERELGVPVITLGKPGGMVSGIDDIFATIRVVGRVIHGDEHEADRLVARLQGELRDVERRVEGRPRPGVAFVYVPRQYAPTVSGKETPEDDLLRLAGARNAFPELRSYETIHLEALILRDPEIIVTNADHVAQVRDDPRLRGLRAVREGHVIGVKSSRIVSSRLGATLRDLAKQLHPSAFTDGDP
ncbi:MAG: ABC transporter substrate-binding protein [Planctomycetota bacterium]|nr:ABC transporter substrate-binding protein [Planctomycetota bacterium]